VIEARAHPSPASGAPSSTTGYAGIEDADHDRSALASTSVARHLARGAIGFGLVGSAVALIPSIGPAALLLAPPGIVALGGCPTCWIAGLIETISAGRLQRTCTDTGCALGLPPTPDRP
jgi:hypothetical protein